MTDDVTIDKMAEKLPFLPVYLAMAVPMAIDEMRGSADPRAEADRLTREHQMRLGVTVSNPDFDAWDGTGTVPSVSGPAASSVAMVLGSMGDSFYYAASTMASPGRKNRKATNLPRSTVVLAALARGFAMAALMQPEGIMVSGMHWCENSSSTMVSPEDSCTRCPSSRPDHPLWIGGGGVEGLAAAVLGAAQRALDEEWRVKIASSEERFAARGGSVA